MRDPTAQIHHHLPQIQLVGSSRLLSFLLSPLSLLRPLSVPGPPYGLVAALETRLGLSLPPHKPLVLSLCDFFGGRLLPRLGSRPPTLRYKLCIVVLAGLRVAEYLPGRSGLLEASLEAVLGPLGKAPGLGPVRVALKGDLTPCLLDLSLGSLLVEIKRGIVGVPGHSQALAVLVLLRLRFLAGAFLVAAFLAAPLALPSGAASTWGMAMTSMGATAPG